MCIYWHATGRWMLTWTALELCMRLWLWSKYSVLLYRETLPQKTRGFQGEFNIDTNEWLTFAWFGWRCMLVLESNVWKTIVLFARYAWTIMTCKTCGNHLGWRFTAVKVDLMPHFAYCRLVFNAVSVVYHLSWAYPVRCEVWMLSALFIFAQPRILPRCFFGLTRSSLMTHPDPSTTSFP